MNRKEIKEYMAKIGRMGGKATLAKHGKKHYKKIRQGGNAKQPAK